MCLFAGPAYERAIERFPALGRALLRRSAEDLFESRALLDLIGRRNARGKVAGFLLAMARAASDSPCHPASAFELPLTRGEMAGLLGITIETVSRQLTQMEDDRVIEREGRRGLRVLEPAALEALAAS
jgi:CRP/FNR family transcriptional regulator